MKIVLFAFTLIVLVSGILANVPSTKYPQRSVGGYSRRSRDANGGQPGGEWHGIGGPSARKGRDVSFVNIIDELELKEAYSGFHGLGARTRRFGRDVSRTSLDRIPLGQENELHHSVIGLKLSRKERDLAPTDTKANANVRKLPQTSGNTKPSGSRRSLGAPSRRA